MLRLSMDGDRVVKRASTRAADGGFRDRSLSQLSGGQWRRASLALELAFVELARQRGRLSCNLLVLVEVLSQLDSYGRARVSGGGERPDVRQLPYTMVTRNINNPLRGEFQRLVSPKSGGKHNTENGS